MCACECVHAHVQCIDVMNTITLRVNSPVLYKQLTVHIYSVQVIMYNVHDTYTIVDRKISFTNFERNFLLQSNKSFTVNGTGFTDFNYSVICDLQRQGQRAAPPPAPHAASQRCSHTRRP